MKGLCVSLSEIIKNSKVFIDYYQILSADKTSTTDQITKAYKKLALKYHPDVCKKINTRTKFMEIQEAYEILSDISKKIKYKVSRL